MSRGLALLAAVVVCAALVVPGPETLAQPASGRAWLALGDSYSSGEGIEGTPPSHSDWFGRNCLRATGEGTAATAWPIDAYRQVREQFGLAEQRFVACTGAITDNVTKEIDEALAMEAAERTGRTTWDLVTFSLGGDNLLFADIVKGCVGKRRKSWGLTDRMGCVETEEQLRHRVDMLVGKAEIDGSEFAGSMTLPAMFDLVSNRVTPGGDVIVVGYPNLIEEVDRWGDWRRNYIARCSLIHKDDVGMLRSVGGYLNEQIARAVAAADLRHRGSGIRFHFLDIARDPYELDGNPANRHARCTDDPWINGVEFDVNEGGERLYTNRSFHPHQKGHTATARVLADFMRANVTFDDVPPSLSPDRVVAAYLAIPGAGVPETVQLVTARGDPFPVRGVDAGRSDSELAFSRDGTWFAAIDGRHISFVDVDTRRERTVECACYGIAFDPEGNAVTVNRNGEIVRYNPALGDRPVKTVPIDFEFDRDEQGHAQVRVVAAHTNVVVVAADEAGVLFAVDAAGAGAYLNADRGEGFGRVAISDDGRRIAYSSAARCDVGVKITVVRDLDFHPPTSRESSVLNPDGATARGTVTSLSFHGDNLIVGWTANGLTPQNTCGRRTRSAVWTTPVPDPGSSQPQPGRWTQLMSEAGHLFLSPIGPSVYTTPSHGTTQLWDLWITPSTPDETARRLVGHADEVVARPMNTVGVIIGEGDNALMIASEVRPKLAACTTVEIIQKRTCGDHKIMIIDAARMPFIARNIRLAWDEGKPFILHRDSAARVANYYKSCRSFVKKYPNKGSCDEYPFASTQEGGQSARTEEVHLDEQRCQGGTVSRTYQDRPITQGERFLVVISHPDKVAKQVWQGEEVRPTTC